jgi:glycosyltransferase involved in cell wall biosynthesis
MPAEPRRILMTADAVGGVWTYALELAGALEPVGIEVTLAVMGPEPAAAQRAAAAAHPNVDLVVKPFKLEWMDDPWTDVDRAGEWLLDLESRCRPGIVHLNGYAHAALPFRAPVVVVGHSCMLSWDAAIPGAIDRGKLEAYSPRVRRGLQAADVVVAPSQAMLDALVACYGPLDRRLVVPNGRRTDRFVAGRKEPFIFTAGRLWDRAKNVAAVVAVAPRIPWPLAIAGPTHIGEHSTDGDAPAPFGHVRTLGVLDELAMAGWLSRASIVALPARYEPFGLLPLEAALSGCALVLGDIPSLREIWGEAACFVDPDDEEALAAALQQLIASPRRLASYAAAARVRAEVYSIEAMRRGYLGAYHVARIHHAARETTACAS